VKNRNLLSIAILCCIIIATVSCTKVQAPQKPNVIYNLADDMGYGDVSALNSIGKI